MKTILIVDDEAPVRFMLQETLENDKYKIITAGSVMEALDIFKNNDIDLTITDLVMPEKNGIDLIMELKKRSPDTHIIAISGGGGITGRFEYLPIAKLVGAECIMEKPFNVQEFRKLVEKILA